MVIMQMTGGLGNQLFQYASGRALAERLGEPYALDISHYDGPQRTPEYGQFRRSFKLPHFKIGAPIATEQDIYRVRDKRRANLVNKLARSLAGRVSSRLLADLHRGIYLEPAEFRFDPNWPRLRGEVYLVGYWQNPRYFADVAATLRAEFVPRDDAIVTRAREMLRGLREGATPGTPLIALHVRRGDLAYASEILKNKTVYGPAVPGEYYHAAAERFDPQSSFVIFSDDPEWCKANLKLANFRVVEGQSDLEDFALMRLCDHFIIPNSSFSWWAAWLCENPSGPRDRRRRIGFMMTFTRL